MSFTGSIRRKCSYPFCKYDCGLPWLVLPFRVEYSFWINIVVKQGRFALTSARLFNSYKAVNRWALL